MQRLSVYGLHRKGHADHGLPEHARFLGAHRTNDALPHSVAGRDHRPALLLQYVD